LFLFWFFVYQHCILCSYVLSPCPKQIRKVWSKHFKKRFREKRKKNWNKFGIYLIPNPFPGKHAYSNNVFVLFLNRHKLKDSSAKLNLYIFNGTNVSKEYFCLTIKGSTFLDSQHWNVKLIWKAFSEKSSFFVRFES
jgi:hypothetical protein